MFYILINSPFFALNTTRQFEQTYEVFQKTIQKYINYKIETFFRMKRIFKNMFLQKVLKVFMIVLKIEKTAALYEK